LLFGISTFLFKLNISELENLLILKKSSYF